MQANMSCRVLRSIPTATFPCCPLPSNAKSPNSRVVFSTLTFRRCRLGISSALPCLASTRIIVPPECQLLSDTELVALHGCRPTYPAARVDMPPEYVECNHYTFCRSQCLTVMNRWVGTAQVR